MSAGFRALLLLLPLAGFAIWGSLHTVEAPQENSDVVLDLHPAKLPAIPDWAKAPLPDFSDYHDTTEKKAAFFSFLYPRVALANSRALIARHYLLQLSRKEALNDNELTWLSKQAERLRVTADPGSAEMFAALIQKLDAIPPSLILAQAANESAWGTSRFAREGNNLFGQWCFSRGCGLVPRNRSDGMNHEVAKFASAYASISSYIQNLNRHRSYMALRIEREKARNHGDFPDGVTLAQGLVHYSERGQHYVDEIQSMIRHNNLDYYDRLFISSAGGRSSESLLQLAAAANEKALLPRQSNEEAANTDQEG